VKRSLVRLAGPSIGVVASVFFAVHAAGVLGADDLARYTTPRALCGVLLAALLYSLTVPLAAWAWRLMLRSSGSTASTLRLLGVLAVAQLGKYTLGSVGQFVGRAALSLRAGIGTRQLVTTVLLETALSILAGVGVGIAAMLLAPGAGAISPFTQPAFAALALGVLAAATLLVLSLGAWLPYVARRLALPGVEAIAIPGRASLSGAYAIYCGAYVVLGGALHALACRLFPGLEHDFALLVGAFALAWLVGFAVPGTPAGLGVREAALLLLLGNAYSAGDATAIIVGLRVATLAGDALTGAAGFVLLARTGGGHVRPPAP
jgi:hypothetical protein